MQAKSSKDAGTGEPAGSAKPCPICGKPATEASHPFCSERCRDVDLNRWLSGSYAIPGRKDEDEEAD
ncbi:MAG TPA: DNA gyrase inhibitor YacG [Bradyrhizobium sp.]|nr:DNA gyrase inhibitor YacG [Bradyrhizobium sp.]